MVGIVSSVGSMATGVIIRPVFAFARAADGMPELELAFEDRRVLCKRRASAVCRNNPALGPWAVTARRYSSKVARKVHPQRLHEGGWRARRGGHLRHVSLFFDGLFQEQPSRLWRQPESFSLVLFARNNKLKLESGFHPWDDFTSSILGKILSRNPSVISSEFVL